jgi:hypothetical protein
MSLTHLGTPKEFRIQDSEARLNRSSALVAADKKLLKRFLMFCGWHKPWRRQTALQDLAEFSSQPSKSGLCFMEAALEGSKYD